MGRTIVAVTKHVLHELLRLPADVQIVSVQPGQVEQCFDMIIEGPPVPDAERCRALCREERTTYEFKPLEED